MGKKPNQKEAKPTPKPKPSESLDTSQKVKIKTDIKEFRDFLTYCCLPGKDVDKENTFFSEMCLTFGKESGKVAITNEAHSGLSVVSYKPKKIDIPGDFWTNNIEHLLRLLTAAKGEVTVTCDGELIQVKGSGVNIKVNNCLKGDITETGEYRFAKDFSGLIQRTGNKVKVGEAEINCYVKTTADIIQQVVKNGRLIQGNVFYPFKVNKEGFLTVESADEYDTITTEIGKVEGFKSENYEGGEFETVYHTGFDNVFSNLSGDVEIFFDFKKPIIVFNKDETFNLTLFIAPRIVSEDEDEETKEGEGGQEAGEEDNEETSSEEEAGESDGSDAKAE
jgi:hypothetical protein